MKVKNLTPHEVNLVGEDGKVIMTFPSEGVIRLSESRELLKEFSIEGGVKISIFKKKFGAGNNLPQKEEGVLYIVSLPVAQAFPERQDFVIPDQLVRDEKGRIIGCRSFASFGGDPK